MELQQFNLCRSISTCLFSRYKLTSFMILNLKVKEGATADWILELEVPFSGRAISFISLLFVINSKVHNTLTWKRSILPNFWVLVKIFIIHFSYKAVRKINFALFCWKVSSVWLCGVLSLKISVTPFEMWINRKNCQKSFIDNLWENKAF